MKLIIDKAIPFISGVFEPYAEVKYMEGAEITSADIRDADALVTRSRTRCDASLLSGSRVKIIATATIGTRHIDMNWCEANGIFVTTSRGSNAGAVMNYVLSSLYGVAARKGILLGGATFGIIGVGNVGRRVEMAARLLGFKVLLYDPLRADSEGEAQFSSLCTLLEESDVISLHAPLNADTVGMADSSFFDRMKMGAVFINASNGYLVVEKDLIEASRKLGAIVIDTWQNEPDIDLELLKVADIATPHIAGYSYSGKQLSTMMAVRSVARFFGIHELFDFFPPSEIKELEAVKLDLHGKSQGQIASAIQYNYPVFTDDFMFRVNPRNFKELRDNYSYRREFYTD